MDMKFGIGQPVRRTEDVRFVTGTGQYTDDIRAEREAHAHFVRSPHPHARVLSIDVDAARAVPGVIGILTHADLDRLGVGMPKGRFIVTNRDGTEALPPRSPLLASGKVRFVGDPVVAIIAEDAAIAADAAELVSVEYEPLPHNVDLKSAQNAETIWDGKPNNISADWEMGNKAATDEAFAKAKTVVALDIRQNRVVANPMEPRACIAAYDAANEHYTLTTSSQGVNNTKGRILEMLNIAPEKLRVITPDVGGGFGMKAFVYPEHGVVMIAAKLFGRPVKWTGDRTEAFLTDAAGRDTQARSELALDENAKILALRVNGLGNTGGYMSQHGAFVQTAGGNRVLGGLYRIPVGYAHIVCYFTNSGTVDAYRGAGRPEGAFLIDRLLDVAAKEIGIDPVEIRRRNLITPEDLPYKTWIGAMVDSSDCVRGLEETVARADAKNFPARKAASKQRGKLRGAGISYYVEAAASPGNEPAKIKFTDTGEALVFVGTQSNGQGHETSFAQIVAENLGIPFHMIRIVQGDSDLHGGTGTGGSRSLVMAGNAVGVSCEEVIKKGKVAAGHVLQAGGADVTFGVVEGTGRFHVVNTPRSITVSELATVLKREAIPGLEGGLDSEGIYASKAGTFPNGCHWAEVEIDEDTGAVEVVAYHVVDDFGRVINPLLLEGQVVGGIAQGLGQVLMEDCIYDSESGQLLTASFTDYAMPRADDMPPLDLSYNEILCKTNPLGAKGAGEAGNVGALPSIMNAIVDALGITHMDMPATPEKVWRALRANGSAV